MATSTAHERGHGMNSHVNVVIDGDILHLAGLGRM